MVERVGAHRFVVRILAPLGCSRCVCLVHLIQVAEKDVANLILRYARDAATVRAVRREYRLMTNEPYDPDSVEGAAEVQCEYTADGIARLLSQHMGYTNSTNRNVVFA